MTPGVNTSWDGPNKALPHPGHINWFRDVRVIQARLTLSFLVPCRQIFYTASRMIFLKSDIVFLGGPHFQDYIQTPTMAYKPLQSSSCLSHISDRLLLLHIHFTWTRTGHADSHFRSCASTLLSPRNILSLDHLVACSHNSSCIKSNAP